MVRRKQSTMFLVAREGDTVAEVRRMVAGVCGQQSQDVRLFLQENTEKGDRISGVFIYFFTLDFFNFVCSRAGGFGGPVLPGSDGGGLPRLLPRHPGGRLERRGTRGHSSLPPPLSSPPPAP